MNKTTILQQGRVSVRWRYNRMLAWLGLVLASLVAAAIPAIADDTAQKPNILVIFGDDIGQSNISAYSRRLDGFHHAEHRPDRQ